jgi:hypothetical protein
VIPDCTEVVCGRRTLTFSDVLLIPAIVGLPTPLYPMQLLVEEAVPASVKRLLNMRMAVLIPEAIYMAFVLVLATVEVKANATLPMLCVAVVVLVIESRGRRGVLGFVVSRVAKESRVITDVPPITMAVALPVQVTSSRSNSACPTLVTMTGKADRRYVCCTSTFVI